MGESNNTSDIDQGISNQNTKISPSNKHNISIGSLINYIFQMNLPVSNGPVKSLKEFITILVLAIVA